jgi:hypothetical protein
MLSLSVLYNYGVDTINYYLVMASSSRLINCQGGRFQGAWYVLQEQGVDHKSDAIEHYQQN